MASIGISILAKFGKLVLFVTSLLHLTRDSGYPTLFSLDTTYEDSFAAIEGRFPRNLSWSDLASQLLDQGEDMSSCQTIGIYSLQRHGSRYPKESIINTFLSFFSRIRESGSINPDFANLKLGKPGMKYPLAKSECLTERGFYELVGISSRLRDRFFPSLHKSSLILDSTFQSTGTNRTKESAMAFILGLCEECSFENQMTNKEDGVIKVYANGTLFSQIVWSSVFEDPVLAPHVMCKLYDDLLDLKKPFHEYYAFRKGPIVRDVLSNVEKQLDSTGGLRMSIDELEALYEICTTDVILFGESEWCRLFSEPDLRVMEYLLDLREYWFSLYGHSINYRPYCKLLQDITSYLNSAHELRDNQPTGIFKFAHSTSIQGILALLDLYRPSVVPTAENYPSDGDWEFRNAIFSPYAANIDFAVFRCSDWSASRNGSVDDFKVLITLNEQPLKLEICDSFFCRLEILTSYLRSKIGSCDLDRMCGNPADK